MLLTTPLPAAQAPSLLPAPAALSAPTLSPTSTAADAQLWALQQHARRYGEEIAAELATLTAHDYRLSLTQVWDRMQHATDALFSSLGEWRMGDYPPDIERVSGALAQIGAWHMVALHVAARLHEPGEGA